MELRATDFRRLLSRAQHGFATEVLEETQQLLDHPDSSAETLIQLFLVRAFAHHESGAADAATDASTRAFELAADGAREGQRSFAGPEGRTVDWIGWQAAALATRSWVFRDANRAAAPWTPAGYVDTSALADLVEAEALLRRAASRSVAAIGHRMIGLTYTNLELFELAAPHLEAVIPAVDGQNDDETHLVDLLNLASLHWSWAAGLEQLELIEPSAAEQLLTHLHEARRWFAVAELQTGPHSLWWENVSGAVADVACWMDPTQIDRLPVVIDPATNGRAHLTQGEVLCCIGRIRALRRLGRPADAVELAGWTRLRSAGTTLMNPVRAALFHQQHLAHLAAGVPGAVEAGKYLTEALKDLWDQRPYALEGVRARRSATVTLEQFRHASRLAERDPLTGLGNRRALSKWLHEHRVGPVSTALVDLDGFKSVNDNFGHQCGDLVLARVSRMLEQFAHTGGLAVRFGGDEFLVLNPNDQLDELVGKITVAFDGLDTTDLDPKLTIRASVGGARALVGEPTASLIDDADRSMFGIKHAHGRQRSIQADPASGTTGCGQAEGADPWAVTADLAPLMQQILDGRTQEAVATLRTSVADRALSPGRRTQLGHLLCWALTVARDYRGVSEECVAQLERAEAWGAPGWRSTALAMRAHNWVELGNRAAALEDLMLAEAGLAAAPDSAGTLGAHRSIANAYLELSLYELALPHYEAAAAGSKQPLSELGRIADLFNLCNLHGRWAEELDRAGATPEVTAGHIEQALLWSRRLDAAGLEPDNAYRPFVELALASMKGLRTPGGGLAMLDELLDGMGPAVFNLAAVALTLRSRQLRDVGEPAAALAAAGQAISRFDGRSESRVAVMEANYELHQAMVALEVPGAVAAQEYVHHCVRRLWRQRLDSVEAIRAQRDLQVLRVREEMLSQLAMTDPLTGLGNRRAFDAWTRSHPVGPAYLSVIDIDGFKQVNDRLGHEVGDRVLLAVAAVIRETVAGRGETVRFGGDEFVVVTSAPLTERQRLALRRIVVDGVDPTVVITTSVGSAEAAPGQSTADLIEQADRNLLQQKASRTAGLPTAREPRPTGVPVEGAR